MNENANLAIPNRKAWDGWREEIAAIGVTNPLRNYDLDPFCQIDLNRAHPGGMAQFTSSGSSTLSNLVRDPLAFSRAHAAAKRIDVKTRQLADHFGVQSCFLVGGLVDLEADGFDLKLPILLWPLQFIRKGDDYEVHRTGDAFVNPALIEALDTCYGAKVEPKALLARLRDDGDLVPIALLDHLTTAVGPNAKLDLRRILAIGNFTTVQTQMLADISSIDVPILNQIAHGLIETQLAEVDLRVTLAVAEADEVQRRIVARGIQGQSFAVEVLPGCGYNQTVVNLLANLAFNNKRVLVLAPRRQTLNEIADQVASLGLNGLVVRATDAWLDTINAISRNEKAAAKPDGSAAQKLEQSQAKLASYFDALSSNQNVLQTSVLAVLNKLAQLSAMPHAPVTQARVERENLLAGVDRNVALDLLAKASELGEFRFGPQDTAWFQARFESPAQVDYALATARRLRDDAYPALAKKLTEFIAAAEFKPAKSVAEFGVYLRLFAGIRESLDRFVPSVFDRSLTEVIAATEPRKIKGEMSGGTRRRLKKLAKEYLRPGMHVSDINLSLKQIEEQRVSWQRYSASLKPPAVTSGINDALVAYQALLSDLESLQGHLDVQSIEPALIDLPLESLAKKLNSLVEDTAVLEHMGERSMVANQLRQLGLEQLTRDLARIHVSPEHIAAEFDLAWWQSSLEYMAEVYPAAVVNLDTDLAEAEEEYRLANNAVLQENRLLVAARLAENWHRDVLGYAVEATALKTQLKQGRAQLSQLLESAPRLMATLAPVLMLSPYEVPTALAPGLKFDTVVVLDAAGTTVAENLCGLQRGAQVITFGDDAIAYPTGFEVEARPIPLGRENQVSSIQSQVENTFGQEVLRRSYRTSGQILGAFINREFYQNRIVFEPTSDDYFDNSHINIEHISDGRANSTIEGANESLDIEVQRAIELVYNHALWHPEDSLLVATASKVHADRIRAGITHGLKQRAHLVEFFEGHGREKFEISTLGALAHRVADHVIFSVGYGKTPEGATLSGMGDLSTLDGRRGLANMVVSARKQITIVSCFSTADLPAHATNGVGYLRELLKGGVHVEVAASELEADPMLEDLAVRLRKLGVTVKTGFGVNLPLVASYGNKALVLQPDWQIAGKNLYQELNLLPVLLGHLGWNIVRVRSFVLFSDPDLFARNLAKKLGLSVSNSVSRFDDERAFEDTDAAWGERAATTDSARDAQLKADKPPHW